jgi:hypothetical protein
MKKRKNKKLILKKNSRLSVHSENLKTKNASHFVERPR